MRGGRGGRTRAEEDGAGAGRLRPVHRAGRRRPGRRRRDGGARALPEHRAELHRRQALHRRGRRSPTPSTQKFAAAAAQAARGRSDWTATTQIGPLARADLRDDAGAIRCERRSRWARRSILGGNADEGAGYFYPPTILTGVTPRCRVFREETFGPVAAVIRARDADDAVSWPTTPSSASAATSGPRDLERGAAARAAASSRAACSSTAWSPPTRACPSVA